MSYVTLPSTTRENSFNTSIYLNSTTLLPTALVKAKSNMGHSLKCRILLDSGSETSFVTEACAQKLQLPRDNARSIITGLGQVGTGATRGKITVSMSYIYSDESICIQAYILPIVTSNIPSSNQEVDSWHHLSNLQLADPKYNIPGAVDFLVGADHFFQVIRDGEIAGASSNQPVAINTIFGWIIAGRIEEQDFAVSYHAAVQVEADIDSSLQKFWQIEELPEQKHYKPDEEECERHFVRTTTRNKDGRYIVRLPFKAPPNLLGKSYSKCFQRLMAIERKGARDPSFYELYRDYMQEFISLGHMEEAVTMNEPNSCFLPHHGVIKSSSTTTKLRVVFDASAKTSSGYSLNDILLVGPVVQNSLYSILIRFRKYKIVFTGDIEKMFRQVLVAAEDQKYQMILWRNNAADQVKAYKLKTVTFGMGPASFLATRVLQQIAENNKVEFPEAAKRIRDDIYVDDLMTGADSVEEARTLRSIIVELLLGSGFLLRKWNTNHPRLLEGLPDAHKELVPKSIEENNKTIKLLGLQWNQLDDSFYFKVNLEGEPIATKRQILSEASRIFDPLGWLAPAVIQVKILFQGLWLQKLGWDDQLPSGLEKEWLLLRNQLTDLQMIKIPRWLSTAEDKVIELHGFADASEKAYAAAVYCRCVTSNNHIEVCLISAKTKVAPLSKTTIPRLELCAAVLLTRLIKTIREALELNIKGVYAWTDSKIVLDWLSSHPSRWPTFVANRTAKILRSIDREKWNHVSSEDNPADCASRGISPQELANFTMWWTGPKWLSREMNHWPKQHPVVISRNLYVSQSVQIPTFYEELAAKYSSWHKFLRILTIVRRFIGSIRRSGEERNKSNKHSNVILSPAEIELCRKTVLKQVQTNYFNAELDSLKRRRPVAAASKLRFLNPFIDEDGLIRVGGRLKHSLASFEQRHPVVLPSCCVAHIIVNDLHIRYHHAGQSFLISTIRQRYWILGCRNLVRRLVHRCTICVKNKATLLKQLMGDLPSFSVEQTRPFLKVGVDYAGPLDIYMRRARGQKSIKSYVCIFVCLSTKAIHIELVGDLTTDTFLGAFKRLTARRGVCSDIYSDNGTNFVGANNQLKQLFEFIKDNYCAISKYLGKSSINWHFNSPSAPHFGGIWESAVRSTKFHLKRVIGQNILTYEEMITLLAEIEAILNSRPLCILSADDIDALTPAHFIIGHPLTQLPEVDLNEVSLNRLSRWQLVKQMSQHFWKRWSDEYLTTLQGRSKWYNNRCEIKEGDIVLVKHENLPPTHWTLGKVEETHPGSDNRVRVVTLKTKSGYLKRPIHKLCLLPTN